MSRTTFFLLMALVVLPMAWLAVVWVPRRAEARGADPSSTRAWRGLYGPLFAAMFALAVLAAVLSATGKL